MEKGQAHCPFSVCVLRVAMHGKPAFFGLVSLGVIGALALAVVGQSPPALPPIAPNLARPAEVIPGLDGPGFAIAFSDEAGMLAAACEHGTIRYWNQDVLMGVRVGGQSPNVLKGHAGPVTALAWNGGPLLASAGADQHILVWNLADGRIVHTLNGGGIVRALAMAPDGKLLASAGDDPVIQLWDPVTGKPGTRLAAHADWVLCLAFSGDGKWLASGGYDGVVRIWDVAQGKKLLEIPAKPVTPPNQPAASTSPVHALAFSSDHKLLAIGDREGLIHLAGTTDGKIARSLSGHTSTVTALAFHASGTVLASGSKDNTVRLWSPANGQALKTLEGHTGWVQGIAFLAHGTRLASVSADQTVRLWDLTPQK
jgi:WD40 repeat protein